MSYTPSKLASSANAHFSLELHHTSIWEHTKYTFIKSAIIEKVATSFRRKKIAGKFFIPMENPGKTKTAGAAFK
jgi:hypothetical protein